MSLLDAIDEAQLVVVDEERRLAFAWFGGQGVNVFDEDGQEVHYFTIGSDARLTPTVVREAIARIRQADDDY